MPTKNSQQIMPAPWKEIVAKQLISLLSLIPDQAYCCLSWVGGKILDRKKGHIARASMQKALPGVPVQERCVIAEVSARHSFAYVLSLPILKRVRYKLHNVSVINDAVAKERGVVIISLHTGPPDLGTLALTRAGVQARTVIGAGKQSPWLNGLGRFALERAGIPFIQRGNPTAVLQAIKNKDAVFLYSDMRSKEVPVTFFGQQTAAPGSGIYAALLTKTPILFHYCTFGNEEVDNEWQLHFESFEIEEKDSRKASVQHNLQRLMHRMESVICENPELWIWHYDRFKLKKKLSIKK